MGLFRTVTTTAAFVMTTGAEIYTYSGIPLPGFSVVGLRQVQVQAPAVITVDKFSIVSTNLETDTGASIVFVPVGSNVADSISCAADEEQIIQPRCDKNCNNVTVSRSHRPGKVESSKIVIPDSGAYNLYLASCMKGAGVSTFTISSPNLGAHERGWWIYFACLVVFYLGIAIMWGRVQRGWNVECTSRPVQEMNFACAISLCMAVAGLLLHAVPEKNSVATGVLFIVTVSASMSSLLVALGLASAVGGIRPTSNSCTAGWLVLFWCIAYFFYGSREVYEDVCDSNHCDHQQQLYKKSIPVFACLLVFGFCCIRYLARSLRYFEQVGQQNDLLGCQRLSGVVFVYSVLVACGMAIRIADIPKGSPNSLGFHCMSEILVGQFAQAFGILATVCILARMDLRPSDTGDEVKPRAYEHVDAESPLPHSPEGETNGEIDKSEAPPVLYGSQT